MALVGLGIYGFLAFYMIRYILKKDHIAFAILLYLAPLSIVSNIVFNIGAPMGERFLFFPSFGFAIAVGVLLNRFVFKSASVNNPIKALTGKPLFILPFTLVLLLFIGKTFIRNADWYDNRTLFAQDVITSENSAKMQYYYANTFIKRYMDDKKPENRPWLDTAEVHLIRSLEINPIFVHGLYNLGLVYSNKDMAEPAKLYLEKTLEVQPLHQKAIRQLGEVHGRLLRNYDTALFYLEKAKYEYGDTDLGLLGNLGNVYAEKGDYQKAITVFEELLATDPNNPQYHANLFITYSRMGQPEKAEQYRKQADALQTPQN